MDYLPLIIYKPKGTKVLVFAPHPDDEILGCGGVLKKHILSGDIVNVIYMTDGSKGCPSNIKLEDIANVRKNEAIAASKKLGVYKVDFAPFIDGNLKVSKETISYVEKKLKKIKPDIIYTPHLNETHPDHKECTNIVNKAVEASGVSTSIFLYEIWNFLNPTHLVNITDVVEEKIDALKEYTSQLFMHNYEVMIMSLNAYRMQQIYDKNLIFKGIKNEQREGREIGKKIELPWRYGEALQYKPIEVVK